MKQLNLELYLDGWAIVICYWQEWAGWTHSQQKTASSVHKWANVIHKENASLTYICIWTYWDHIPYWHSKAWLWIHIWCSGTSLNSDLENSNSFAPTDRKALPTDFIPFLFCSTRDHISGESTDFFQFKKEHYFTQKPGWSYVNKDMQRPFDQGSLGLWHIVWNSWE